MKVEVNNYPPLPINRRTHLNMQQILFIGKLSHTVNTYLTLTGFKDQSPKKRGTVICFASEIRIMKNGTKVLVAYSINYEMQASMIQEKFFFYQM